MTDQEIKEVPVPRDVKVSGGYREQTKQDQVLWMLAGVFMVCLGLFLSIRGQTLLIVFGSVFFGVALERLQWMLRADYGSWREAILAVFGGESA